MPNVPRFEEGKQWGSIRMVRMDNAQYMVNIISNPWRVSSIERKLQDGSYREIWNLGAVAQFKVTGNVG